MTVVTVCLNAAATVETALRSVLDSTASGFELEYIVIDGGSTDGTMDIVDRYRDRLTRVISESDEGIYDAFNKGIALATGDFIGILNADDLYLPHTLEKVAEAGSAHPEVHIFYGRAVFVDEKRKHWILSALPSVEEAFRKGRLMPHVACFVTREGYRRFGAFDRRYKIAGDTDFLYRCYRGGALFYPLDAPLTLMRSGGASRPRLRTYRELWAVWLRHLPLPLAAWRVAVSLTRCGLRLLSSLCGLYALLEKRRVQSAGGGDYRDLPSLVQTLAQTSASGSGGR
jgi:glycosyltransferase involved in cell wall biosynthesis